MQETHPLRVFPDGGDEHVTSNLKVDGLEPSTLRLEVTCSIQLSYGAKLV